MHLAVSSDKENSTPHANVDFYFYGRTARKRRGFEAKVFIRARSEKMWSRQNIDVVENLRQTDKYYHDSRRPSSSADNRGCRQLVSELVTVGSLHYSYSVTDYGASFSLPSPKNLSLVICCHQVIESVLLRRDDESWRKHGPLPFTHRHLLTGATLLGNDGADSRNQKDCGIACHRYDVAAPVPPTPGNTTSDYTTTGRQDR